MLDNLTQRLARVMKTLRGEARLSEENIADALREVRLALLEADVALHAVKASVSYTHLDVYTRQPYEHVQRCPEPYRLP